MDIIILEALNRTKKIIADRGGQYIEELIINGKKYTHLICDNGHDIIKRSDAFKNSWCQECQKFTIEDARNLASIRGLKFLSDTYTDRDAEYLWECSNGHQWTAKFNIGRIKGGCAQCLRVPFSFYTELIIGKGGTLITTESEYVNNESRIIFICKEGHRCNPIGQSLRSGTWCWYCNTSLCERTCIKIFQYLFNRYFPKSKHLINPETGAGLELDGYDEELKLAFEYNGRQHYEKVGYWQTDEEFESQKNRDRIKAELCQKSGINLIIIPYTVKYKDLYSFIVEQFPEYNFEKTINYDILNIGSNNQYWIDEIQKIAVKNKGKLSTKYIDCNTELDFICVRKHLFKTTLSRLRQCSFCKQCYRNDNMTKRSNNKTIPKINNFCNKYYYEYLSKYVNPCDKMLWRCNKCYQEFEKSWSTMSQLVNRHTGCTGDITFEILFG
jgi:hypothetical protein